MTYQEIRDKYPKQKFTKEYNRNLKGTSKGKLTFENYRDDAEKLDVYILEAEDHNAFNETKNQFLYDYKFGTPKDEYRDSFKRIVKVTKIK